MTHRMLRPAVLVTAFVGVWSTLALASRGQEVARLDALAWLGLDEASVMLVVFANAGLWAVVYLVIASGDGSGRLPASGFAGAALACLVLVFQHPELAGYHLVGLLACSAAAVAAWVRAHWRSGAPARRLARAERLRATGTKTVGRVTHIALREKVDPRGEKPLFILTARFDTPAGPRKHRQTIPLALTEVPPLGGTVLLWYTGDGSRQVHLEPDPACPPNPDPHAHYPLEGDLA